MLFLESVGIALRALVANKLRSILTLVGVVIGVATVIAVTSIIAGMDRYVANQLATLGSNTFMVDKFGIITSDDAWFDAMKRKNLTLEDVAAIRLHCPDCQFVEAQAWAQGRVKYGNQFMSDVDIVGLTHDFNEVTSINVDQHAAGHFLTESDEERRHQVCILGYELQDRLFGRLNPLGRRVKVRDQEYTVVGLAKKRGSFLGWNQDNFVAIPISTFGKYLGNDFWGRQSYTFYVKAADYRAMERAQDQVRLILRARRHVPYEKPDNFAIYTASTIMNVYRGFTTGAYVVMIGIASIALIVGGIVIMNIMLVSVTERTREVGIRKALGARKKNILLQFLIEAVTVALVGGMLGILLGVGLAQLLAVVSPLPAAVSWFWILIGLFVSTSVGIFFGIYPAARAARLDPIEALRYE